MVSLEDQIKMLTDEVKRLTVVVQTQARWLLATDDAVDRDLAQRLQVRVSEFAST